MKQECRHKRACLKLAVVLGAITLAVAGLSQLITTEALDELKHNLSLWSVIALVVIINLVSVACFIVLNAAYQWIRRDLKPSNRE